MPPITTVASGRWTSAPVPVTRAIGIKRKEATRVDINTGRNRFRAPSLTAELNECPSSRRLRMKAIITRQFSTATSDKAIKPTPAEIDSGMSRSHKAMTRLVNEKGIPVNTNSPSLRLLNIMNSSANTMSRATGTTICRRFAADWSFSNCPPILSNSQLGFAPAVQWRCWLPI